MIVGVPREIKKEEYRVAVTPAGVAELKKDGHTVIVESEAGVGSGFSDVEYLMAGAEIMGRAQIFRQSELVVKVKELIPEEYDLLHEGQAIFTFLHLAPNPELTQVLLRNKVTGLAYETLEKDGSLPLLAPMSEIAGRMAPIMASYFLQQFLGGEGVLPTGCLGVSPARALVLGAGIVGFNAARVCLGMGMETVVLNRGLDRLRRLDELFLGRVKTLPLTDHQVRDEIHNADIVIGALLVPGGKTPVVVSRDMLATMRRGAVIVDVSVDQGGCIETSRPTTHDEPVYEVDGIVHYAVANMPGAYPRSSTMALTNATLPYVKMLSTVGVERSIREDHAVRTSLNTYKGDIVNKALADSLGIPYKDLHE